MKFDSTYKNSHRTDYDQFARFLNGRNATRECCNAAPVAPCEPAHRHHRPVGMVYCENQEWENIFDVELGMTRGTIFEALDLPFERSSCRDGRSCRG